MSASTQQHTTMPAAFFGHGSPMNALEVGSGNVVRAPTPDHFIPLLYIAGLAGAAHRSLEALVEGCASAKSSR